MVLKKKGRYCYGTEPEDTTTEVQRYSELNGYKALKFSQSVCACGSRSFVLETDEEEGAARRTSTACRASHLMGDSADHVQDANLEHHECVCGAEEFNLLSGVSLYEGSNDVRWYYIGCRCAKCHLVGVFTDWKFEGGDANDFLANT